MTEMLILGLAIIVWFIIGYVVLLVLGLIVLNIENHYQTKRESKRGIVDE